MSAHIFEGKVKILGTNKKSEEIVSFYLIFCAFNKFNCDEGVSCVSQCLSAPSIPNVLHVAMEISVGGRLQSFWQVWQKLGVNPRVVSVLRDGYSLPFRERPYLSRFLLIVSEYSNPLKNKALLEALTSLIQKKAVEKVVVKSSLAFYNHLFLVPKPNRKWRPILDLSKLNLFLTTSTFKMETPETIRLSLQKREWVTSLDFSDAYFHIPIAQKSRKYLRFHLSKVNFQFTSLPFGLATAPLEFTKVAKEVKLMAQAKGIRIHQYLDDWLLRAPCRASCLHHTQILMALCQELGWVVNMKKSELIPQQVFNFVGYQFDLLTGRGFTHSGPVVYSETKVKVHQGPERLYSQTIHVIDRSAHGNGETGLVRSPSYEAHPVAPEATLARSGGSGQGYSIAPVSSSSPRLVVGREQCTTGSASTSSAARTAVVYRHLKRRLGHSLRGLHCKRRLVRTRKSPPHKFFGAKGSVSGPQEFRASLQGPDCSGSNGQHNCGILHQQRRGYEIRLSLCPPLETSILVPSQGNSPEGKAHSRSLERDSGQAVQAQSGNPNRVVPGSTGVQSLVLELGSASGGLVCHSAQSQTPQVCVTGSGSDSLGGGRPESSMGKSAGLRFSSSLSAPPSDFQGGGSGLSQNDPDCSGVAQHALVLGPGQSFSSGSLSTSTSKGSGDSAIQQPSSQEPQQFESACLAPRASAIQEQGFTDEVAARIEAPQRLSTRAVYKSKWSIFVKWCDSHEVDFRSPSISQIADFLLYLFKERKLQPSTIEGYRTAIADMVGNEKLNISKDENPAVGQFS